MKYFSRILLFVSFVSYTALALFFGPKPASVFDVVLFSWILYCAISEKLENMQ